MVKLSTGEYAEGEIPTEDVMRHAYAAWAGVNNAAREGAKPGEGVPIDGAIVLEGLYALAAAIIDSMPQIQTNADRRIMAELSGARVNAYLKQFKAATEQSGVRAIELFGSMLTPEKGSMN